MPVRFLLTLEPDGSACWSDVEPRDRLRRAVKALGSSYGLRVVSCRPADAPPPATTSDAVRELAAADPSLSPPELAQRVGCSRMLAGKALTRTPQPRAPDGHRKIDCCRRLLRERPDLSANEIARRCRCDRALVSQARERPRRSFPSA